MSWRKPVIDIDALGLCNAHDINLYADVISLCHVDLRRCRLLFGTYYRHRLWSIKRTKRNLPLHFTGVIPFETAGRKLDDDTSGRGGDGAP